MPVRTQAGRPMGSGLVSQGQAGTKRYWLKRSVSSPGGRRQDDGAQVGARSPAAALRGGAGALYLRLARGDFQGARRRLPGYVRHQPRHQLLPRLHLQVGGAPTPIQRILSVSALLRLHPLPLSGRGGVVGLRGGFVLRKRGEYPSDFSFSRFRRLFRTGDHQEIQGCRNSESEGCTILGSVFRAWGTRTLLESSLVFGHPVIFLAKIRKWLFFCLL